jgi:PAS domain S-box-containing protein
MVAKPSSLLVSQDQGEQTKFVPDKVSAGRIVESLETVGERKDRRSFPALLTVSPIRDAVGTVKGVSTIAADATAAQKKSLDILPAMNDQDSNC